MTDCQVIIRPEPDVVSYSSSRFTPIRNQPQNSGENVLANNYYSRTSAKIAPRETKRLEIEVDQEVDGRWIAEISEIPGAMVYGSSKEDAISRVVQLAFRTLAEDVDDTSETIAVNLTLLVPHA
jgi:predicted RNase H-like HicB family nuclease